MGTKEETLTIHQIPSHAHNLGAPQAGGGAWSGYTYNAPVVNSTNVNLMATGYTGGGQAHNNMPPVIVVNYEVIAV